MLPRPMCMALTAAAALTVTLASCSSTSTTATGSSTTPPTTAPTLSGASAPGTTVPAGFTLTSSAFENGQQIPKVYTCDGDKPVPSPPLAWSGVPAGTTSLDLVVVDPDAPVAGGFTHWVSPNIAPSTTSLPQGSPGYTAPCPPSGNHHYIFTLYAFGSAPTATDRAGIEGAGNVLGQATLTGMYMKQ
jgi:phosphatidylethanolamine-binding protein (PEBP) family uncharacterized protein